MRETYGIEIEGRVMGHDRTLRSFDGGRADKGASKESQSVGVYKETTPQVGKSHVLLGPLHGGARSRKRGKPYPMGYPAK